MCCGGCNSGCSGGCGKSPYTYIRFASDKDGSDFSHTKNGGGIERCFQAVITSPTKLDEDTLSFKSLFNDLWFNVCDCGCDDKGCVEFPINTPDYITHNGENVWNFNNSTSPTYEVDVNVVNSIIIDNFDVDTSEDLLISNFVQKDGSPLQPETRYCVKFDFNWGSMDIDYHYPTVTLSFGDNGETFIIDSQEPGRPDNYQFILKTGENGVIPSNTLNIHIWGMDGIDGVLISNLRVDSAECCEDCGCLPNPPKDSKIYGIQDNVWVEIENIAGSDIFHELADESEFDDLVNNNLLQKGHIYKYVQNTDATIGDNVIVYETADSENTTFAEHYLKLKTLNCDYVINNLSYPILSREMFGNYLNENELYVWGCRVWKVSVGGVLNNFPNDSINPNDNNDGIVFVEEFDEDFYEWIELKSFGNVIEDAYGNKWFFNDFRYNLFWTNISSSKVGSISNSTINGIYNNTVGSISNSTVNGNIYNSMVGSISNSTVNGNINNNTVNSISNSTVNGNINNSIVDSISNSTINGIYNSMVQGINIINFEILQIKDCYFGNGCSLLNYTDKSENRQLSFDNVRITKAGSAPNPLDFSGQSVFVDMDFKNCEFSDLTLNFDFGTEKVTLENIFVKGVVDLSFDTTSNPITVSYWGHVGTLTNNNTLLTADYQGILIDA